VTLFRLTVLCALLICGPVRAEYETRLRDAGPAIGMRLAGAEDPGAASRVYIVQLRTPAAAEIYAAAAPRVIGKPSAGTSQALPSFDKNSSLVQNHVQRLESEQLAVIARAGPGIEQIYSYKYSLNGFAARMSPAQANKLEHMPEVLQVWEDEVRPLATNHSASFLGLFDPQTGLRGLGLDGEGIIIGVIDSGIYPEHPALQDTRLADRPKLCWSQWAEVSLLGRWLCHDWKQ